VYDVTGGNMKTWALTILLTTPLAAAPTLVNPSGPFGIGRMGYDWVDTARPDPISEKPEAHREIMAYLWYPTSMKRADARGTFIPGAKQMDAVPELQRVMSKEFGANWPLIVSGEIFSHAVEQAPAVKNVRFPVVIFSHGMGGTGFEYTSLIEDTVSRGYVVAAIEHTGSARVVVFPDGRSVPFHEDGPRMGMQGVGIDEGAADVRFALDRLTELNAGDAAKLPLAGKLDLSRVAAMGHSAGAEYAARACQLDARFKACVDLDGGMVPLAALPDSGDGGRMRQPLLLLEADHPISQMMGTPEQLDGYFKKKEEQLQSCPPGSYNIVMKSPGIAHPSFSDTPLLFAGQQGFPNTNVVLHNHELIEKFVRAFLDKNLKQRKAPLLDEPNQAIPEAVIQRYGH
jgi:dienelactone hydrolase